MSTKPTLVLIPGSFGISDLYEPTVSPFLAKGLKAHILDPPCYPKGYKKGIPAPAMYDDAKFIADFITKLADQGDEVVVLAHSYGGIPATESLKGITKTEREKEGKKGGVIRIAYLTAMAPKVGENLVQTIKGGALPIEANEEGWLQHTDPEATAALCFNHLPKDEGVKFATDFGKHSSRSFADPLTHNGYKDVPVSWFFCEDDLCVSPEVQQTAIDVIEESWKGTEREGKKVDVTKVWCDHTPTFSAKAELHKWIEGLFE